MLIFLCHNYIVSSVTQTVTKLLRVLKFISGLKTIKQNDGMHLIRVMCKIWVSLQKWKSVWDHQVVSILLFTKANRFLDIYHFEIHFCVRQCNIEIYFHAMLCEKMETAAYDPKHRWIPAHLHLLYSNIVFSIHYSNTLKIAVILCQIC